MHPVLMPVCAYLPEHRLACLCACLHVHMIACSSMFTLMYHHVLKRSCESEHAATRACGKSETGFLPVRVRAVIHMTQSNMPNEKDYRLWLQSLPGKQASYETRLAASTYDMAMAGGHHAPAVVPIVGGAYMCMALHADKEQWDVKIRTLENHISCGCGLASF